MKELNKGFTLVELLIVVAILSVLASIAVPAYLEYVKQARRADGRAGLAQLQLSQEKFRTNCVQYAAGIDTSSTSPTCDTAAGTYKLLGSTTSPEGYYTLSMSNIAATTYTLTATRVSAKAQANDECGDFIINQDSVKTLVNNSYAVEKCWKK